MIEIKGIQFSVNIERKRIKNLYLKVNGTTIEASVPFYVLDYEVYKFINTKRDWVYNAYLHSQYKMKTTLKYMGGDSFYIFNEKYKIRDKRQLRAWIKVYNGHKDFKKRTGGSRMTKARKTTKEERIAIARECIESGRNYGEIAIKNNVSYQQVYNWTNKYAELGDSGLEDRRGQRTAQQEPRTPEEELRIRIAQLEHELYMKEMECNLLKKLDEIERRRG